ncbi:MAG: hypothetical protein RLZZ511_2384 [Cyanobacteriota bacterium]|jgi:hypothetical protein
MLVAEIGRIWFLVDQTEVMTRNLNGRRKTSLSGLAIPNSTACIDRVGMMGVIVGWRRLWAWDARPYGSLTPVRAHFPRPQPRNAAL